MAIRPIRNSSDHESALKRIQALMSAKPGTDEGDESTTFNGTIPQVLMMFNGDMVRKATGSDRVLGSLGLGLAISRELARRMDGDLSYAYRDGESIFRLELPGA